MGPLQKNRFRGLESLPPPDSPEGTTKKGRPQKPPPPFADQVMAGHLAAYFFPTTASVAAFETRNLRTVLAAILIDSPVAGL